MKKTYNAPKLSVYGSIEQLTQKHLGIGDAICFSGSDRSIDGSSGSPYSVSPTIGS